MCYCKEVGHNPVTDKMFSSPFIYFGNFFNPHSGDNYFRTIYLPWLFFFSNTVTLLSFKSCVSTLNRLLEVFFFQFVQISVSLVLDYDDDDVHDETDRYFSQYIYFYYVSLIRSCPFLVRADFTDGYRLLRNIVLMKRCGGNIWCQCGCSFCKIAVVILTLMYWRGEIILNFIANKERIKTLRYGLTSGYELRKL